MSAPVTQSSAATGHAVSSDRKQDDDPTPVATDADFVAVFSTPKRTWKSYIWSSWDCPPEEARFLNKLDLTLITAAAYGVLIRYLDQVNIVNAFNSGMREDLSLYGNELNYAQSLWSVGYVIGQIPSNLILIRIPSAPLYIAFLEIAWTLATFGSAAVTKPAHIYGLRFVVGLFESGHFPAVMYIASSYYKPHELARRNGIIQVFTSVGPLFSGFMMAAVHAGLHGKLGLAGWRWMFIICGCVSLPSAIWTAFALPQLPGRAEANWVFTQDEIDLARRRMPTEKKMMTGLFKWKDIKRWHTTWQAWLMPAFFIVAGQLGQSGQSMIYWLRSYNKPGQPPVYSVTQINLIPLGLNGLIIVGALIADWISDNLPGSARWPIMAFCCSWGSVMGIALAASPVYPDNRSIRMALYYLCAFSSLQGGVTWTLVNEVCRTDPEKRAYVGSLMNALTFAFGAWVPILTFPTSQQPVIVVGNYVNAGFGIYGVAMAVAIAWYYRRDKRRAQAAALSVSAGSVPAEAYPGRDGGAGASEQAETPTEEKYGLGEQKYGSVDAEHGLGGDMEREGEGEGRRADEVVLVPLEQPLGLATLGKQTASR